MEEIYIIVVAKPNTEDEDKSAIITYAIPDKSRYLSIIQKIEECENDWYYAYLDGSTKTAYGMDLTEFIIDNKTYDYKKVHVKRVITCFV